MRSDDPFDFEPEETGEYFIQVEIQSLVKGTVLDSNKIKLIVE